MAVNSLLSILLDHKTGGAMGFLISTATIVVFGEITPQVSSIVLCAHDLQIEIACVCVYGTAYMIVDMQSWNTIVHANT